MIVTTRLVSATQPGSPSNSVELPGSACPGLSSCEKIRGCNPTHPMQVSLILKSPLDLPQPVPFQPMSAADHARYEATPAQVAQVSAFARDHGLSVASVDPETRTVKLQGTVEACQKAFGVKMATYKSPQAPGPFRAYDAGAQNERGSARGNQPQYPTHILRHINLPRSSPLPPTQH